MGVAAAISRRGPYSKAREYDSRTVVQPCIWFKEEPSQFSMGQKAPGQTCSIMEIPYTGLDECPRILLACFRARNSGQSAYSVDCSLSLSLSLSGELGDELLEKWRKTITRSRRPHCLYSRLISDSASKTLDEMRQTVRLSELMSRCLAEFSRLISLYRREMLLLFKQGCAFLLLFKQGCHNFSR